MNQHQEALKELRELSQKIRDEELMILDKSHQIELGRVRFKEGILEIQKIIANEKDENGKLVHSNDMKREIALKEILVGHELSILKEQLDNDEFELDKRKINLSFLKRSLQIADIVSRC